MELLYIWIKEYRGLKNIGLNFSNEIKFHFDGSKTLTISKFENYIPDFFGPNISNLTALIGENGSGKTSALRFIIELLNDGKYGNKFKECIIFYKENNKYSYFNSVPIFLNFENEKKNLFEFHKVDYVKPTSIIVYLSNTFDPTSNDTKDFLSQQLGELKNLTTWFLLYADYQARTGRDPFTNVLTYEDRLTAFAAEERIRMVKLLRWLNQKETNGRPFPVNPPDYINIKLFYNYDDSEKEEFTILSSALFDNYKFSQTKKNKFLINTFIAAIYQIAAESIFILGDGSISDTYKNLPQLIIKYLHEKFSIVNLSHQVGSHLNEILNEILKIKKINVVREPLLKVQSFLKKLDEFIQKNATIINEDCTISSLKLTKANKKALIELIDEYYITNRIINFVDLYFSHNTKGETSISSGEYALLNLFARLNNVKIESNKPILLLMDEAELALHPQWQKEFIHHLIDFINERFLNHKVQIIITAHSPFILSDLPSNCVVLLKKETDKTVIVENLENKQETFGANIHELFTDSFFLQNGLMGEFARNKIDTLINEIKDAKSITKEEYDKKYRSRINIIGEPFLRSKINELVARKSEISVIDSIIDQRTEEIEILRQLKNKRKDDQN